MSLQEIIPPVQLNYASLEPFAVSLHKASLQTDELSRAVTGYDFGNWNSTARQGADDHLRNVGSVYATPIAGNYIGVASVFKTLAVELQALDQGQNQLNAKWEDTRNQLNSQITQAQQSVTQAERNVQAAHAEDNRKNLLDRAGDVANKVVGGRTSLDNAYSNLNGSRSQLNQLQDEGARAGQEYLNMRERILEEIRDAYRRAAANVSAVLAETGSGFSNKSGESLELEGHIRASLRNVGVGKVLTAGDEAVLQRVLTSGNAGDLAVHLIFLPGLGQQLEVLAASDPAVASLVTNAVGRLEDFFGWIGQNPDVVGTWLAQREAGLPAEQQALLARLRGIEGSYDNLAVIAPPVNTDPNPAPQPEEEDQGLLGEAWDLLGQGANGAWDFFTNGPLGRGVQDIIGNYSDPIGGIINNIQQGNWGGALGDFGRLALFTPVENAIVIGRTAAGVGGELIEGGIEVGREALGGAAGVARELGGAGLGALREAGGAVLGVGREAGGAVLGIGREAGGAVLGMGREALGGVVGAGRELGGGILGTGRQLFIGGDSSVLAEISGGVGGTLRELAGGVGGIAREAAGGVGGVAREAAGGVGGVAREAAGGVGGVGRELAGGVGGAVREGVGGNLGVLREQGETIAEVLGGSR